MAFNKCNYCGADNGRAGILWNIPSENIEHACENCYKTLSTGEIVLHTHLSRTDEEIKKTMDLLTNKITRNESNN